MTFQGALKICQEAFQSVSGPLSGLLAEGGGSFWVAQWGSEEFLQSLSEPPFRAFQEPILKPVRAFTGPLRACQRHLKGL